MRDDEEAQVTTGKRGRGGRGARARGSRGRRGGRGRGKKIVSQISTSVAAEEQVEPDMEPGEQEEDESHPIVEVNDNHLIAKDIETESTNSLTGNAPSSVATESISTELKAAATAVPTPTPQTQLLSQALDMEADISQLEAPTFTTISRGPPEPMLRLKWDHKVNLIGEKVSNPLIHCCDQCDKPILVYGRMIPCKHVFCLKCARTEPIKVCPRCNDKVARVEQSGLGTVFMCTHGGSRYGNTGCRRTYLSQRDLQAHINHRHVIAQLVTTTPNATITAPNETKQDVGMETMKSMIGTQRKFSESSSATVLQQTPPSMLAQQRSTPQQRCIVTAQQPTTHSHSSLTQANLARINNANAQECLQGKAALHQTLKKTTISQSSMHQPPETVADASYYSSVLNSFGGGN